MEYVFVIFISLIFFPIIYRIFTIDKNRLGMEKFAYLILLFFYYLVPVFFVIFFESLKENTYNFWILRTELSFSSFVYVMLIYTIALVSLLLGVELGKKKRFRFDSLNKRNIDIFFIILKLISIFSILITVIYTVKVGGPVRAIFDANLYRAHGLMEQPVGQFSKFQPYILYTSIILLAQKRKINYIFILFSIYYLLIEASRTNFALYFLSLYMFYHNVRGTFNFKKLVFPLFFAVFLAYFGNAVTFYIQTGEWELRGSAFYSILSQFSPTISNVFNIEEFSSKVGYRFFSDAISIIPQSISGIEKEAKTWQVLTEYYLGYFDTVGIPIDLFSYGYSQLSFIGVSVWCFIYGLTLGVGVSYIKFLRENESCYFISHSMEVVFSLFAMYIIGWASLDSTVFYGTSKFWIPIIIFVIVSRIKTRNVL